MNSPLPPDSRSAAGDNPYRAPAESIVEPQPAGQLEAEGVAKLRSEFHRQMRRLAKFWIATAIPAEYVFLKVAAMDNESGSLFDVGTAEAITMSTPSLICLALGAATYFGGLLGMYVGLATSCLLFVISLLRLLFGGPAWFFALLSGITVVQSINAVRCEWRLQLAEMA